ncbi:hypothetical protein [Mycetocola reblochoni]|uniref:Transporter n=2 Tax=Mycetocola reblochoni TaxID=331618 RepID=A0A3L6ZNX7_9MICO|nr:hypothetical protein [Mycetocola reblochoni]RLP69231.1 hypothetical protein D9V30_07915 [Mycetocola reblochoni]SJN41503.1 putative integral membrane transport protein [Mycetocola reblochoni REB411]
MVAELLRLRFRVLGNTLSRHPWQLVGMIIGGLYALGLLAGAVAGLVALRVGEGQIDPSLRDAILVIAGSLLVLGWTVGPFVRTGGDDVLDPSRFSHLPIATDTLLRAAFVATLLGIPGIVTIVAVLATVIPWTVSLPAALAALIGGALGVVTCVIASRVVASLANRLAAGRRFREVVGLIVIVPLVLLAPLLNLIGAAASSLTDLPGIVAPVLAWTPLGAPWAIPADVAAGHGGVALLRLLLCLAVIALLALAWKRVTIASLGRPATASTRTRSRSGAGLFDVVPATVAGAIAARALIYWFKDPRYSRQLVSVVALPVLFLALGSVGPSGFMIPLAGPLVAAMLALTMYTDVSYDGSAFAAHLTRSVRGRDDRWGRAAAGLVLGIPLTVVVVVVSALVGGDGADAVPLLAISLTVLFAGVGISAVSSAAVVMPVQKPSDSPFSTPPGSAGISLLLSLVVMVALLVVTAPVVVPGIIAMVTGSTAALVTTVVVAIVLAPALLVIGVVVGGRVLDRKGPELLARLTSMNA